MNRPQSRRPWHGSNPSSGDRGGAGTHAQWCLVFDGGSKREWLRATPYFAWVTAALGWFIQSALSGYIQGFYDEFGRNLRSRRGHPVSPGAPEYVQHSGKTQLTGSQSMLT